MQDALPVPKVDATFADGKVSGNGGVNQYSGAYKVDGSKMTVSEIASTAMAGEQVVMDQEAAYLANLEAAGTSRSMETRSPSRVSPPTRFWSSLPPKNRDIRRLAGRNPVNSRDASQVLRQALRRTSAEPQHGVAHLRRLAGGYLQVVGNPDLDLLVRQAAGGSRSLRTPPSLPSGSCCVGPRLVGGLCLVGDRCAPRLPSVSPRSRPW